MPLDGKTPQASSHKKGILKNTVSNNSNLPGLGSPLSRSGSYLGTLDKLQDQNEGLGSTVHLKLTGALRRMSTYLLFNQHLMTGYLKTKA